MAAHVVSMGPAPGIRNKSRFPHEYRNGEGADEANWQNFKDWEVPTGGDDPKYYEYPILPSARQPFDYSKRTPSKKQVERPLHPNDRARAMQTPLNNPGAIRAVTTNNQNYVVGAIYHPQGNPQGYERAAMQPLDRHGRIIARQYRESQIRGARTWNNDSEWE
ncbi:hypothetical protein F4819DRAFT_486019 [Hypoxylon fuscum]|nr:hypothetical protein F4819DRAFT_486019 [Hypoxylon fuscum]